MSELHACGPDKTADTLVKITSLTTICEDKAFNFQHSLVYINKH